MDYKEMNQIHIDLINRNGKERFDLAKYNCIFDEGRQELNNKLPHKHDVFQSWDIKFSNHSNSIAFSYYIYGNLRFVSGCNEKDFDKKRLK